LASLILIVAMFALLWLLLIRPQRQKAVAEQRMRDAVDVGDEILTVGGLYGTVTGVGDESGELWVQLAPEVEVRMDKRAVAQVVRKDEEDDGADEPEVEEAEGEVVEEPEATASADGEQSRTSLP
jgi:preprotein translocase subunit YajC